MCVCVSMVLLLHLRCIAVWLREWRVACAASRKPSRSLVTPLQLNHHGLFPTVPCRCSMS